MKKLSPLKTIKMECKNCKETNTEIRNCNMKWCTLFPFKLGKKVKGTSSLKMIRKYCLWCEEGFWGVKNCVIPMCPLYPYRLGKNPLRKGLGNKDIFLFKK